MPTTHTWKGAGVGNGSGPFIYDQSQYTDGQAFAPGDTLVVNGGSPTIGSVNGDLANLRTGNYVFNGAALTTGHIELDAASTLSVNGPGQFEWDLDGQFVNGGTIQVGSPTASGNAFVFMYSGANNPVTLTNNGSITIQNNSQVRLEPQLGLTRTLANAAGANLNVESGSFLNYSDTFNETRADTTSNTTNNGLITVTGSAGQKTEAALGGSYQGSGLLSVRGAPGDLAGNTRAQINAAASGTFDVASGEVWFSATPVSGTVNLLDNRSAIYDDYSPGNYARGNPFGATINGFQAGDVLDVATPPINAALTPASNYSLSWDASKNLLTLSDGSETIGQFTLAGSYQQSDFRLQLAGVTNSVLVVTTTSTANAITPFAVQDVTTGAVATNPGQQYSGPVNYLQSQYTWSSADKVNVTTGLPDVYLVGGAGDDALAALSGSNVLDGGAGSNFLTGAKGSDGGTDTFFLDASKGVTWDTLVNFHPGDSVTLWGFVPGTSSDTWAASDGAANYQGATLHAAFAGAGTPVNGSVTFAGINQATQQAHFSVTSGSSGGRDYLYVHYNS